MPKFSRGVVRLLGVLALAALLTPAAVSVAAGSAGRDYSRCVQACNDARRACGDRCQTDCRDLYPTDANARNACIAACKVICDSQSDDCKLVCQQIKNGGCPTEP